MSLDELTTALQPTGLEVRGGFQEGDTTLILIGNCGGGFWPKFATSGFEGANALDHWTQHVLDPIAEKLKADALYPFTQPYHPFLTWVEKAEGLRASPLGLAIHPQYGLWHAYRAAFRFPYKVDLPVGIIGEHPCDTCDDKPCLSACPVGAFKLDTYDVDACRTHVRNGDNHCAQSGCLARQACPVGREYMSSIPQQQFHMRAFIGP